MLGDYIAADGNPRESYLSHLMSTKSPHSPRNRVASPYIPRDPSFWAQYPPNHVAFTPHYSPRQDDFASPEYWSPSKLEPSPEPRGLQHGGAYDANGGINHQAALHWSPKNQPSPASRPMMDNGRAGTLHQSLRSPQYSPLMAMPSYPDEGRHNGNPNQLRKEKGKKIASTGSRSSAKLATDMRRCFF
jgi:hypothetical protein